MFSDGVDAEAAIEKTRKILEILAEGRPTVQTAKAALECATALLRSLKLANGYIDT